MQRFRRFQLKDLFKEIFWVDLTSIKYFVLYFDKYFNLYIWRVFWGEFNNFVLLLVFDIW